MPSMDIRPDEEITAAEAAAILGANRREIPRLVQRGVLEPSRKLPGATGAYLFRRSAVDELLEQRKAS